jgi:hypothetical protein
LEFSETLKSKEDEPMESAYAMAGTAVLEKAASAAAWNTGIKIFVSVLLRT